MIKNSNNCLVYTFKKHYYLLFNYLIIIIIYLNIIIILFEHFCILCFQLSEKQRREMAEYRKRASQMEAERQIHCNNNLLNQIQAILWTNKVRK